jgi:DNA-binding transcriptional LysR family regulator
MPVGLQHFEFFMAIVRERSFSAAAGALYTSQPHVSNKISELEKHYGVTLFDRTGPEVSLTDAGKAFCEQVRALLEQKEDIDALMQEWRGLRRGHLEIGSTAAGGSHVLPGFISRYRAEFGSITVGRRVGNTSDVEDWLHDGVVEVGVCPREPAASSLSSIAFFEDALIAICPADHPLEVGATLAELVEHPMVVREPGSLTRQRMEEVLSRETNELNVVAEFQGTSALNEAVASGIGLSLVPSQSAKRWLEARRVRDLRVCEIDVKHVYYMVFRKKRYLSPPARAFIEILTSDTGVRAGVP